MCVCVHFFGLVFRLPMQFNEVLFLRKLEEYKLQNLKISDVALKKNNKSFVVFKSRVC